mgnify:CR=1 FL=1
MLAGALPPSELGVSALDEHTLQISMSGHTPYFLVLLTHPTTYPVHRASLQEHGQAFSRPGNLVSNGAFVLTEWTPRTRIVLERNPNFREAENTLLERVLYVPTEEQTTEVNQFRLGELDWTSEVPSTRMSTATILMRIIRAKGTFSIIGRRLRGRSRGCPWWPPGRG